MPYSHSSKLKTVFLSLKVCLSAPDHRLHGAHQLLRTALAHVDGRRRRLVQMRLHLAAVVVDMTTLAVAHGPVAVATAASR